MQNMGQLNCSSQLIACSLHQLCPTNPLHTIHNYGDISLHYSLSTATVLLCTTIVHVPHMCTNQISGWLQDMQNIETMDQRNSCTI